MFVVIVTGEFSCIIAHTTEHCTETEAIDIVSVPYNSQVTVTL